VSGDIFSSVGVRHVRRIIPLILALGLVITISWATAAYAQTSAEAQYANPAPKAAAPATTGSVGGKATGGSGGGASTGGAGSKAAGGSSRGAPQNLKVLPSTGGPLLPLAGLGALALGATGLLALQRNRRP
jgi:LPXTG-motif cell wall-anchored protein